MFLDKKEVKSEYIAIRVTPEIKDRLKEVARQEGITLSSAVMQLAKMGYDYYKIEEEAR